MIKMIYIMNVDWNWIKQRPHFLAEELSKYFDVRVLYQYRYGRRGLQKRGTQGFNVKPLYVIPRGDRYKLLRKINFFIKRSMLGKEIKKNNVSMLYLTFPEQIKWVPKTYKGRIVYDCMDNHPAFVDEKNQSEIIENEKKLINVSDKVFVTSNNLLEKLVIRYGESCREKLELVRNGYGGTVLDSTEFLGEITNEKNVFSYFGTISSWFDFEFILKCLDENENVIFELYGPIDGVNIPEHERLIYKGTVEHDKLKDIARKSKCLIMPFVVNEIIEAVDPVKLYEYINFNKNILCCKYDEIVRFDKFVYFYNNYEEFNKIVREISMKTVTKYTNEERIDFLRQNRWEIRGKRIKEIISEI